MPVLINISISGTIKYGRKLRIPNSLNTSSLLIFGVDLNNNRIYRTRAIRDVDQLTSSVSSLLIYIDILASINSGRKLKMILILNNIKVIA